LQSVVTVRQCQAVQQCHTYLLTDYPVGYPDNELSDKGSFGHRLTLDIAPLSEGTSLQRCSKLSELFGIVNYKYCSYCFLIHKLLSYTEKHTSDNIQCRTRRNINSYKI